MKILLFSNDLMPFGNLPTSGGGLRCWQLYKGLQAHGFEVIVSMPAFTYLTQKHYAEIPEAQRELLWNWPDQDTIFKRERPDAVLFASNWDHFNINVPMDVPLIIDLHGSRLIETRMWNTPVDTERKLSILSKADCLLTAGMRQRLYFYGWLLQAGRVPEDEHFIRYIPISLDPQQPQHRLSDPSDTEFPLFVSGGGWFPWQNQSKLIFAACEAVNRRGRGRVEIFGTPHESPGKSPEEETIREIYKKVCSIAEQSPRVRVNGYISRTDLIDLYCGASVALECMDYNLERELAFTTRTIEYLWCGLPVIYNNYGEISEHIAEYDAGWCVDPTSSEQIQAALREIFEDPRAVTRKSLNASRLVGERFSWDKTIMPLVEFLNHPSRQPAVEPAYGYVVSRSSFLSPRGTTVDVPLPVDGTALSQTFIVPAENMAAIEVGVAMPSRECREAISALEIQIHSAGGKLVKRAAFSADRIPVNGKVTVEFPRFKRPKGGEQMTLNAKLIAEPSGNTADSPLCLRGLVESCYPFVGAENSPLPPGKTLMGGTVQVSALALNFIPGVDSLYRWKMMRERVVWLIKERQWRRLAQAVIKRLPRVVQRLKLAVSRT